MHRLNIPGRAHYELETEKNQGEEHVKALQSGPEDRIRITIKIKSSGVRTPAQ
jgi:hypothetical protein